MTYLDKWVELVWTKMISQQAVILMDSYEVHSQIQAQLAGLNTKCIEIPSGCSLKLQPLNVLAKDTFLVSAETNLIINDYYLNA